MINYKEINLKKEIEICRDLSGKERGIDIKYLADYAKNKYGEKKLKEIEKEIKKHGIDFPEIYKLDDMEWVPISLANIFFVTMIKVLGLKEEDIFLLGRNVIMLSPVVRIFLKYFVSVNKTVKEAAKTWQKHFSYGEVEIVNLDKKHKKIILRLKKIKRHPFTCIYDRGVFYGVMSLATGSENIEVKEIKCMHKGDRYHEFVIKY